GNGINGVADAESRPRTQLRGIAVEGIDEDRPTGDLGERRGGPRLARADRENGARVVEREGPAEAQNALSLRQQDARRTIVPGRGFRAEHPWHVDQLDYSRLDPALGGRVFVGGSQPALVG